MIKVSFRENTNLGHRSSDHEKLRRSVLNGIVEFWYSIRQKLHSMQSHKNNLTRISIDLEAAEKDLKLLFK